jgi:hypothetical protein
MYTCRRGNRQQTVQESDDIQGNNLACNGTDTENMVLHKKKIHRSISFLWVQNIVPDTHSLPTDQECMVMAN